MRGGRRYKIYFFEKDIGTWVIQCETIPSSTVETYQYHARAWPDPVIVRSIKLNSSFDHAPSLPDVHVWPAAAKRGAIKMKFSNFMLKMRMKCMKMGCNVRTQVVRLHLTLCLRTLRAARAKGSGQSKR